VTGKILVVSCNWDGWSCIDAALNSGHTIPSNVNIIKIPCMSSVNSGIILRAFESNMDGILFIGCLNEQCHYGQCNGSLDREISKAGQILDLLGIKEGKLQLTKLEPFNGEGFIEQLNRFNSLILRENNDN
jgi:coenzyme F420-reducing hydrogenase delta subunit